MISLVVMIFFFVLPLRKIIVLRFLFSTLGSLVIAMISLSIWKKYRSLFTFKGIYFEKYNSRQFFFNLNQYYIKIF